VVGNNTVNIFLRSYEREALKNELRINNDNLYNKIDTNKKDV